MNGSNGNIAGIVRYKQLKWFYVASLSLIATGFLFRSRSTVEASIILLFLNMVGLALVYRLNDCIDQDAELSLNLRKFFHNQLNRILVFVLALLIPVSYFILDRNTFGILSISAFFGILYSIKFKFGQLHLRLKNVFLVKNVLIGIMWGNLVLIGAGNFQSRTVVFIYLLACIQVFIGGVIRDVPDLQKDREEGVQSLPLVFGDTKTIVILHFLNFVSWFLLIFEFNLATLLLVGIVSIWRFLNLIFLKRNTNDKRFSQTFNLLTCTVLFIITLALKHHGSI